MESTLNSHLQYNNSKQYPDETCKLFYETRYFLNNSKTKSISVGLTYDNSSNLFTPSIWFGGSKVKNSIVLYEKDWINLLSYKNVINSSENENRNSIMLNSCKISFESFNDIRVLKLEDNYLNCIYLGEESVNGLWLISDVVQYRLNILQSLNFDSYFKNILVTTVSNINYNKLSDCVLRNIDSISTSSLSENVCIAKEFIAYHSSFLEHIKRRPFGYGYYNDNCAV